MLHFRGLLAIALSALPLIAAADLPLRCAAAADAFVATLSDSQRPRTVRPFAGEARRQWAYITGSKARPFGLRLGDMQPEQRLLAHRLVDCGLSSQGYHKATAIIRLDDVVAENIHEIAFNVTGPVEIGSGWYWLTVLGEPGGAEPWGFKFEGHHLALNFSVIDGLVSATPAFFGADPAEVTRGTLAGARLLIRERDRAFALLQSLDEKQLGRAIIDDTVPRGVFTRPGRADALQSPQGLAARDMSGSQRQLLWLLINEYVGNMAPEVADRLIARLLNDDAGRIHFAWMGPVTPGDAIYYRVHGPSILIEFDHSANIRSKKLEPDPNHVHTIFRVPGGDFGEDLLQRHYNTAPHHQESAP